MIAFITQYWYFILAIILLFLFLIFVIYNIIKEPQRIKEWLLYAVTYAEKELGTGTGQIKLRYVYDLFITHFPIVSKFITFDYFSSLVDEALKKLEELLENDNIATFIKI